MDREEILNKEKEQAKEEGESTSSNSNNKSENETKHNLLTLETVNVLLNDFESKDQEIAVLKESQYKLKQQLQSSIEEANKLRTRLVEIASEKEYSTRNLQANSKETSNEIHLQLSTDEKLLMEEKMNLSLTVLGLQKENTLLKKKNLRLGELIMQRDAYITTLTKEKDALLGVQEELYTSQTIKDEIQSANSILKEEAIRHTSELQQEKAISLALRQELARIRQERESLEKEYYRVENALQKNNDSLLSYQQQLGDAVTRRNTLAQMVDDGKREIKLLENKLLDVSNKATKLQLDYQEIELQRSHWENLMRSEVERTDLVRKEYNELKEGYKDLYIYYMNLKTENDRLQRQCEQLASDAELARASVLTYKSSLHKNTKTFEDLLKENVFLSNMLKQKEGQMEEAELYWKNQYSELVKQVANEEQDIPLPETIPPFVPTSSNARGGYSYPLPSDHPFIQSKPPETPQRATIPEVAKGRYDRDSTSSKGTLPTQTLSGMSPLSTTVEQSSFTSASFESLLNDVIKQTEELRRITDYYESQDSYVC